MEINKYNIYNKNAKTTMMLAKLFLQLDVGDKMPTFEELTEEIGVARGTIQKSLKLLQESSAISVKSKGHLGTFIEDKNYKILLKMANINSLLGSMSLPYSKTYEGLATGIITTMEDKYDIPVRMAYMRNAVKRIDEMIKGRYDFTVVCKDSADIAINEGKPVHIAINFGLKTYLSVHVLLFSELNETEIRDGMRVGLAKNSQNQNTKTKRACEGKNVEFVTLDYSKVISSLKNKEIDTTVWNRDEINDVLMQINTKPIFSPDDDTTAVILVSSQNKGYAKLLKEIIDVEEVKRIQKGVIFEEIAPRY